MQFGIARSVALYLPLMSICAAVKLPPLTTSVATLPSYLLSSASQKSKDGHTEMECDVLPKAASVVIIDDVLSIGGTLCAVLRLLEEPGLSTEHTGMTVAAEIPMHHAREPLRQRGFGKVRMQRLLESNTVRR